MYGVLNPEVEGRILIGSPIVSLRQCNLTALIFCEVLTKQKPMQFGLKQCLKEIYKPIFFEPENESPLNELNPNESEQVKLFFSNFFKHFAGAQGVLKFCLLIIR